MISMITKNEGFNQGINLNSMCKDGGVINKPVAILFSNIISLLMVYVTYCVLPKRLKIPFLVLYGILFTLPVYDFIQLFVLSNKQLEQKCLNIVNQRIRVDGLWKLWMTINVIVGIVMWISLFYYIIRYMFYWENVCKK